MDLFLSKRDDGKTNVEEGKLPSERDFHSEGGDVSNIHLHTPPLIASEAAIDGGGIPSILHGRRVIEQ